MQTVSEQPIIRKLMKPSKTQLILNALKRGERISKADMVHRFGVYHSSDVAFRLRKKGHNIQTVMVEGEDGVRYARYHLKSA